MSEPWTPGPWNFGDERPDWPEGRYVGHANYPSGVALVWKDPDARLIALAPEMAELLEYAVRGDLMVGLELSSWQQRVRDLLARARGETA